MVSEALAEAVVAGELLMESVSDKLCWRRGVVGVYCDMERCTGLIEGCGRGVVG
jgi:hypothetical protein